MSSTVQCGIACVFAVKQRRHRGVQDGLGKMCEQANWWLQAGTTVATIQGFIFTAFLFRIFRATLCTSSAVVVTQCWVDSYIRSSSMAWSPQLCFARQRGMSCQLGESSDESIIETTSENKKSMEHSHGLNQPIWLGAGTKPTSLDPTSDTNATQLRLKL